MSRFFVAADVHRMLDIDRINIYNFPEQTELTKDDYLIIAGDFGCVWGQDKRMDSLLIKDHDRRCFTTLFVDGNHENHDLLDSYPVEIWNGGKIHRLSASVIHLMRGQVYSIGGHTFFTMGGAESTDKMYRQPGVSWWEREMPSDDEYAEALKNLEAVNFKVDYVITHCAPEEYLETVTSFWYYGPKNNRLTSFLSQLITKHNISFKEWYFGHYHLDMIHDHIHCVFRCVDELKP